MTLVTQSLNVSFWDEDIMSLATAQLFGLMQEQKSILKRNKNKVCVKNAQ